MEEYDSNPFQDPFNVFKFHLLVFFCLFFIFRFMIYIMDQFTEHFVIGLENF